MTLMTDAEIDEAVLAVAQDHWSKVAMIIAKAADRLGKDLPKGDEGYIRIATHQLSCAKRSIGFAR